MSIDQISKPNLRKLFTDFFYILILATSILLFLFTLNLGLRSFQTGKDLEVFCQAGRVIAKEGNPYLTSQLGLELSWNYPSALAYGFYFACPLFNLEQNYIWIYTILFLLGLGLWFTHKDWLYGIILCSTGLFTLGWTMITGNISTIEFLLFSISIFLFFRKKINASLFVFGMFASLKLIPILYLPAFLILQTNTKDKIKAIAWSLAGFISLLLLSFITSPHLFTWYLRQMFGLIPNQHNPLNEFEPLVLNQSLSVAILSLLGLESQLEELNLIFSLGIYILGIFALYSVYKTLYKPENHFVIFSLAIILLTIFMPRLKPYSFLPAILCFYLISKEQSNLLKSLYLILLSIMPTIFHLIYFYTENNEKIFAFHQTIFLVVAAFLLIFNLNKKVSP
ncbi:MAG: DUF2029 domain-containing protein [Anaerolineales bacterium]|nr:DUF2029 domain-containing protein [Anaerolineales bacterium]MBX3037659.1 DUF2029 domain-containing protein [Anaerolineales bacterium]